jgi:hypothetical protein
VAGCMVGMKGEGVFYYSRALFAFIYRQFRLYSLEYIFSCSEGVYFGRHRLQYLDNLPVFMFLKALASISLLHNGQVFILGNGHGLVFIQFLQYLHNPSFSPLLMLNLSKGISIKQCLQILVLGKLESVIFSVIFFSFMIALVLELHYQEHIGDAWD